MLPPANPTDSSASSSSLGLPDERYRTYLVFGAPGAGKGTQGKVLGTVPRFYHVACGDVFRSLDTRTKLGKSFFEYSSRGELVPDALTIELWQEFIDGQVDADRFKPDLDSLVLDGIPRNVEQARLMENLIDVRRVFHLSCPDRDELVRRLRKRALKDNRYDDASETVIRRRLATYEAETRPVLQYYGSDRVQTIDATQSPARVLWEILGAITALGDGQDPTAHHADDAASRHVSRDNGQHAASLTTAHRDGAIPVQG